MKGWFLWTFIIRAPMFIVLELAWIHDWRTSAAFFIVFSTLHLFGALESIDERRRRTVMIDSARDWRRIE